MEEFGDEEYQFRKISRLHDIITLFLDIFIWIGTTTCMYYIVFWGLFQYKNDIYDIEWNLTS